MKLQKYRMRWLMPSGRNSARLWLAPYALSTLDREETHTLEEHLATCRDCPRELDEWQGTIAALALLAAPAEPSPRVRANIFGSIQAQREPIPTVLPFPQTKGLW